MPATPFYPPRVDTPEQVTISNASISVDVPVSANFYHGQTVVVTPGTDVVLGSSQALTSGVTIKALHDNTGFIYVGKVGVSSADGYVLDAGEAVLIITDNIADVYIDASVGGEGVSWQGS